MTRQRGKQATTVKKNANRINTWRSTGTAYGNNDKGRRWGEKNEGKYITGKRKNFAKRNLENDAKRKIRK